MGDLWTPVRQEQELAGGETVGSTVLLAPTSVSETSVFTLADGRLEVYTAERIAIADGDSIDMSPKEFDVLALLAKQRDRLVTHEHLSQSVWDDASFHSRSRCPTTTMGHLRKRLGGELGDIQNGAIRSRLGLGYVAVSSLCDYSRPQITGDDLQPYRLADERIEIDRTNQLVVCDGEILNRITPRQFKLLAHLARKPDRVAGFAELAIRVWGNEAAFNRGEGIRQGISQLRKNLGPELGDIDTGVIRTRFDVGYYAVKSLELE